MTGTSGIAPIIEQARQDLAGQPRGRVREALERQPHTWLVEQLLDVTLGTPDVPAPRAEGTGTLSVTGADDSGARAARRTRVRAWALDTDGLRAFVDHYRTLTREVLERDGLLTGPPPKGSVLIGPGCRSQAGEELLVEAKDLPRAKAHALAFVLQAAPEIGAHGTWRDPRRRTGRQRHRRRPETDQQPRGRRAGAPRPYGERRGEHPDLRSRPCHPDEPGGRWLGYSSPPVWRGDSAVRFGVGNMRRGLGGAVLVVGLVAGCGSGGAGTSAPATQTSPTADKSESAGKGGVARGGTVGGAGSACELPVSFDVAERWKPDAVDSAATADAELAALLRQGYVTMVCELDAKPAGHLGFLRVWTGEPGNADARQVLEAFLKAEGDGVGETRFRTFRTGDLSGVEVEYRQTVEALDETKTERALAVVAPDGPVVLHLGGLDDEEHKDMLPAYELAKRTLRVTS